MKNIFKFIRNTYVRIIRNYLCLSTQKKSLSLLSAFLSLYTFEIDYLDPYICSVASSMLATIGIYGTYGSLMKIAKQGRRTLKPKSSLSVKEPLYMFTKFSNLNGQNIKSFLDKYNENQNN